MAIAQQITNYPKQNTKSKPKASSLISHEAVAWMLDLVPISSDYTDVIYVYHCIPPKSLHCQYRLCVGQRWGLVLVFSAHRSLLAL